MDSTRSALARHRASGEAWWQTAISRVEPNTIELRGYPIQELIGRLSYTEALALLVLGRRLLPAEVALLDAALVSGVDHGPRAPSIAAARMAATCGVGFNSAVATGINLLGDHHGGAVEGFMVLIAELRDGDAGRVVADHRARRVPVPGFGHQLHDRDPRRERLLALLTEARAAGAIDGGFLDAALAVETALEAAVGRPVPLNVDGLSGIVYLELGFPPAVAKGLFSLSRGAGIVAHALEELQAGLRIKGPCPPGEDLVRYVGPPSRSLVTPVAGTGELEREFWSTFGEAGVCVYWGVARDAFDALEPDARRRLVGFTQSVADGPADERGELLERVAALPEAERLAALVDRAR